MDPNPYDPAGVAPNELQSCNPIFGESIHASIVMTPEFLIESLTRFRTKNRLRRFWMKARWLMATLLFLIVGCAVYQSEFLIAFGMTGFICFSFSPHRIDDWLTRRRLVRSPQMNEAFAVEITDAGVHA